MLKIDNRFWDETTYFIGDLCIIGCQCFTLDEAPEVFADYNVPEAMRDDVRRNLPQPDWSLGDADTTTLFYVAYHPTTPPQALALLAQDADVSVRTAVACHPRTPPEVLALLAQDADAGVRWAVGRHPRTPPEVLALLAQDADVDVRRAVAGRPVAPPAGVGL